ncbi:MAG: hypothetical protein ACE14O_06895 [Candidatus Cloacimonadaceae bacterium]
MKKDIRQVTLPVIILLIVTMITVGCTRKDNFAGNHWSDVTPMTAIADSFKLGFSFSKPDTVSGSESYLLCGEAEGINCITVMRFTGLSDTMTVIGQPVLKLVASRCSNSAKTAVELSFHKLQTNWAADSTFLIQDADIVPLSIPHCEVDTVHTAGDTLLINLPPAVIQNWQTANVTGFNLAVKMESPGWIEFKSTELGYGPKLTFDYQLSGSTDTLTYNQTAVLDSYRYTGTQPATESDRWKLKNLLPQRIYARFTLPEFKDKEGNTLPPDEVKWLTVNKAELVLFIKDTNYYNNHLASFYPFNVTAANIPTAPVQLALSDLESIDNTVTSYKKAAENDSVKINITPIVQGFTSGKLQNKGIVLVNTNELSNFGNLEFWHFSNAPAGKKPYVKIYYTTPLFED